MAYYFRVPGWANDIYNYGTQRFTARDGCSGIDPIYQEDVKKYAAANFYNSVIDDALKKGFINQEEHAQTMAYRTSTSPTLAPKAPGDEPIV